MKINRLKVVGALFAVSGLSLFAWANGWAAFSTYEAGGVSVCLPHTCPNGAVLTAVGGSCDFPRRCCVHYNCTLQEATVAVCCSTGQWCNLTVTPTGAFSWCQTTP